MLLRVSAQDVRGGDHQAHGQAAVPNVPPVGSAPLHELALRVSRCLCDADALREGPGIDPHPVLLPPPTPTPGLPSSVRRCISCAQFDYKWVQERGEKWVRDQDGVGPEASQLRKDRIAIAHTNSAVFWMLLPVMVRAHWGVRVRASARAFMLASHARLVLTHKHIMSCRSATSLPPPSPPASCATRASVNCFFLLKGLPLADVLPCSCADVSRNFGFCGSVEGPTPRDS